MKRIITLLLVSIILNAHAQPEKPDIFLSHKEMVQTGGGGSAADYASLNTSGANIVKTGLIFSTTGTYRVDLVAYSLNQTPIVKVDVDGVSVNITVPSSYNSSSSPGIFSALLPSITAGTHTLTISLTNYSAMAGVGLIYLTRSSSATPYVYPVIKKDDRTIVAGQYLTARHFGSGHLRGFSKGLFSSNSDMDALKATGANLVRLWVKMDTVVGGNSYIWRVADTALLRSNINYLTAMGGVYMIITVDVRPNDVGQIYWGTSARAIAYRTSIASKWKALANVWKSNKMIAAFDIVNEPRGSGGYNFNYAEVIRFQQQILDSIRTVDSNHVVAIEVENNDMLAKFIPLPDTNLIYSPHGYSPMNITHQGIAPHTVRNKYPTITPTSNQGVFGKTELSKQHDGPRAMANRFHVPIWYGEFGCASWAPLNDAGKWSSTEWGNDNISLIEAEGFSWAYLAWRPVAIWDPEIPQTFWNSFTFTNASPTANPGSDVYASARSDTAPTIVMLKGWFGLNVASNITPSADAGPDTLLVLPTDTATLMGKGNDPDGQVMNFLWTKIAGPSSVIISSPTLSTTQVAIGGQGAYSFELRVTDSKGAVAKDTVSVVLVAGVLPLKLLSFSGKLVNENVRLEWETSNEWNVTGYQVEKMTGTTWNRLATVRPAFGNRAANHYGMMDFSPPSGANFYRLKIESTDGNINYSNVLGIEVSGGNSFFQNFPNPFSSNTAIKFELVEKTDLKIIVYNSLGSEVAVLFNGTKMAGPHMVQWNTANLAPGNYYYKIATTNNHVVTKKMLKLE